MTCSKCDADLEFAIELSPKRTWRGGHCQGCDLNFNLAYGGLDEHVDLSGFDGEVVMATRGHELVLTVNGSTVILPADRATRFLETMEDFASTLRSRALKDRIQREQLNRWLLHRDGATYRDPWHGAFEATLRKTVPRRDWGCVTCKRTLQAGEYHWMGEYTERRYAAPPKPRFCSACVHESRSVSPAEPQVPRGLRLVDDASEGLG